MEFTTESIDALTVNEVEIMKKIAEELSIRVQQVSAVISLVEEGCTIPFISRYRKENTTIWMRFRFATVIICINRITIWKTAVWKL